MELLPLYYGITATTLRHHCGGLGVHLWCWSMMWFMCSDEICIQNRSFIALSGMSHDHSISSFFPTSCCSDESGSDRAVQSQRYLPSSHCHFTSLPFHRNHLTLAVVCLSITIIASPNHCNTTAILLYNYPLILSWRFDWERSAVTLPTYSKTTGMLQWKKLWYSCEGFQILKTFEGRTANMVVKVWMMTVVLPQPVNLSIFALRSSL